MKQLLKEFCLKIGIEYVGIAPAGPYHELETIWQQRLNQGHITGFEERDFQKRIDPRLTLPVAKSVIVCLFPYFAGSNEGSNLSKSSFSVDYHILVKSKLKQIGEFLSSRIPNFEYKAFVDNGPLVDRYLAYLSGLGYYGINGHIITDCYGSYVFIGYLITNYAFEPDEPLKKTCIQCGQCVKCCPGCAILGNFDINPLQCKSYITQKKGELTEEETRILKKSNLIFGCDICQDVCPHNADVPHTKMAEFRQDIMESIEPLDLEQLSNREFTKKYGNRAFSWRGKGILLRNQNIIHKEKDR